MSNALSPIPGFTARPSRLLVFTLVALALLCLAARLRLLDMPLERDEGEFAYTAQLVLEGESPYKAYNYKLPGVAYSYALAFLALGDTVRAVHLALLVANAGATVFLFLLAWRRYGVFVAGLAAVAYAFASLDSSVLGQVAHATQFANCCGLAGLWACDVAARTSKRYGFLLAGVALGLALLMKQHAVFFLPLALLQTAACIAPTRAWRLRLGSALSPCLWLCLGFALPVAAVAAAAAAQGAFDVFLTWTIHYAAAATSTVGPVEGWLALKSALVELFAAFPWLWATAPLGFVLALRRDGEFWAKVFPTLYLLLCIPAVAAGLYFRAHYFILALPPVCLASALCFDALRLALADRGRLAELLALAVFIAGISFTLYTRRDFFFLTAPDALSKKLYQTNPFVESQTVASFLRQRSGPSERVAVFGSEAQLYFYAQRRAATGFIYMYGLADNGPYSRVMQEGMLAEVEAAAPRIVVFVWIQTSWSVADPGFGAFFARIGNFLQHRYLLTGYVEIEPQGARYHWDQDARAAFREHPNQILVYERR